MSLKLSNSKSLDKLVTACIKQDRKAQHALYDRFAPIMHTVCLRYVKDTAEAEDVLLKGFMKVFQNVKNFRQEGSIEGWIRRIIVNEALMYIRRNKTMYLEVDIEEAQEAKTVRVDHLVEQDLMRLVQSLPLGYSTVFNLFVIEGYSHQEIADMLNISEGTSKSQLSRAKQLLRNLILKQEQTVNDKNQLG